MWQDRVKQQGCSILRVLAVLAGAEGIVEGIALIVLCCITINGAMYYRAIAQAHLTAAEMDHYLRVYYLDVSVASITMLSFMASAIINAMLFAGAFLSVAKLVMWARKGYVLLYSWFLPLSLIRGVLWAIGGEFGYPGMVLVYICLLKIACWWIIWLYGKHLKKISSTEIK